VVKYIDKREWPPAASKRRTAQTILDATERLCATHGIEAVSIRDIAAEAGVAIAVIYHHYKSKGNLLRTILRTRFDEIKDDPDECVCLEMTRCITHVSRAAIAPLGRAS